jgi:hypothetical protein
MSYDAKIVLDSVGPNGARATTFELTMPRIVLAEFNTHRMFSRNAASSRAIPVEKLLKRIEDDPMLPVFWGKNQSGMQAAEELTGEARERAQVEWLLMRDYAVSSARALAGPAINLHKQIANRIVEPWMFTTVVVTATEWDNAWGLRVDPQAQPEFEKVMHKAYDLYKNSDPRTLASGEWHLPYVTGNDEGILIAVGCTEEELCLISTGRCARVSYLTHDGVRDPLADIALPKDRLIPSGHMSPLEHPLQAMTALEWEECAMVAALAWIQKRVPVGNVWGFRQFRKTFKNEHNFMLLKDKKA